MLETQFYSLCLPLPCLCSVWQIKKKKTLKKGKKERKSQREQSSHSSRQVEGGYAPHESRIVTTATISSMSSSEAGDGETMTYSFAGLLESRLVTFLWVLLVSVSSFLYFGLDCVVPHS